MRHANEARPALIFSAQEIRFNGPISLISQIRFAIAVSL
jgi:hypothetical protein